jgi:DNA polymerase-3 subunit alpha
MGARRRQLMEAMPRAISAVEEAQKDRRLGQLNLFESLGGDNGDEAPRCDLPDIPEWPTVEKLKHEKESLDFYITSHPLTQYRDLIERFAAHRVEGLGHCDQNQEVFLGGILTQVRYQNTKKARNGNSRFARCKLEDFTGTVECLIWPDDLVKHQELVVDDRVCFVSGTVDKSREQLIVQMSRVLTLEQGQLERTTGLVVTLDLCHESDREIRLLDSLAAALKRAPRGGCPVFLYVRDGAGRWLRLKAGDDYKVNPATLVKADLEAVVGSGRVEFSRQGGTNGR